MGWVGLGYGVRRGGVLLVQQFFSFKNLEENSNHIHDLGTPFSVSKIND